MPRLLDVSPTVSPRIGVWPGDVPYRREVALSFAKGDHLELSAVHATLHLGAHADAPIHYVPDGAGIAERPLELYYGPCRVLDVPMARGARMRPDDLPAGALDDVPPRVLLRTGTFPDPERWNEDFAALSPELVDVLAARGVRLVGLDTPSVDLQDDRELRTHHAIARHDMAVLEGLVLGHVEPGDYLLIALPLKLEGADASPVRAVLVADD